MNWRSPIATHALRAIQRRLPYLQHRHTVEDVPMRWLLCLCLLYGLISPLAASDLYTGEVLVPDQSEAARTIAMAEALKQVLVKVSGDPSAAGRASVQSALADPAPLIQAFYFRQDVDRSGPTPVLKLYYAANFEPRAITRLLSASGLSQWARERPTLMVWVASDVDGDSQLLGEGQIAPLLRRASDRGLEVKAAPVSDEVALADVERGAVANLRELASRYGAPGVLAGRLYSTGSEVVGRFAYADGEREESFEVRGADTLATLRAAADETANRLASRYAFAAADSAPAPVSAVIRGIRSAADFARVHAYLSSLSVVREIKLSSAAGDSMNLDLSVAGGAERLRQMVSLNALLSVAGDSTDGQLVLDLQ